MSDDRRMFDKVVGERLREARLTLGVTQSELAIALGVSAVTVARYELGERSLPIAQLPRIAQLLRCPITTLLPGAEREAPAPGADALPPSVATIARLLVTHPEIVPPLLDTLEQLLERQRAEPLTSN